ncbi:unnamed protein product [Amaranthus hypochondriacus]
MAFQKITPIFILTFFTFLCFIRYTTSEGNNEPVFLGWKCDYSNGNYTKNSPYHINLLNAFSNLTSYSSSNTFADYVASTDEDDNTNKVYALYDCRKDLTLRTCHDCVADATIKLLQRCPSLEAIATYEECMLRYANHPILSMLEQTPHYTDCEISIPDEGELSRIIKPIFKNLIDEAISNNSTSSKYFAAKKEDYFEYQKVYCLVQCTPDITQQECEDCLTEAMNATLECASGSRMISYYSVPSCQIRYDVVRHFFNVSSNDTLSPMASPPSLSSISAINNAYQLLSFDLFLSFKIIFCVIMLLI